MGEGHRTRTGLLSERWPLTSSTEHPDLFFGLDTTNGLASGRLLPCTEDVPSLLSRCDWTSLLLSNNNNNNK
jgi:hypothetical protein